MGGEKACESKIHRETSDWKEHGYFLGIHLKPAYNYPVSSAIINQFIKEIGELFLPPGPIVVDIMAPQVDPGRYSLGFQDGLEGMDISVHGLFPGALPGADDDVATAVSFQVPGIFQISQIKQRRIEIDAVIHIIANEHPELEDTTQADQAVEYIGVAEEEVGGVVTAHAGASSQEKLLILTVLVDECSHFLSDVAVISLVASATFGRRNVPIDPGLAVYAVDRIKTKNPLLNEMTGASIMPKFSKS
jgi:hypothetical protein